MIDHLIVKEETYTTLNDAITQTKLGKRIIEIAIDINKMAGYRKVHKYVIENVFIQLSKDDKQTIHYKTVKRAIEKIITDKQRLSNGYIGKRKKRKKNTTNIVFEK